MILTIDELLIDGTLTIDECEVLAAKLRSAIAAQRKIVNDIAEFSDAMHSDWSYQDRYMTSQTTTYGQVNWYMVGTFNQALWHIGEDLNRHLDTRHDLADLLS